MIKPKEEFKEFQKTPRLSRECTITEKIDGTNGLIYITEDNQIHAGSRSKWIIPEEDNYGFAGWVEKNKEELLKLGPGRHFGEWWGNGIQRKYGMKQNVFSLFNIKLWSNHDVRPKCCSVVPTLYTGPFDTKAITDVLEILAKNGSFAAPGFMKPEGVMVWHESARMYFKKTIEKDNEPKSLR